MSWSKLHRRVYQYQDHNRITHDKATKSQDGNAPTSTKEKVTSELCQGDTLNHGFCIVNAVLDTSTGYVHYAVGMEYSLSGYRLVDLDLKLQNVPVLRYPRLS